jgi:hypothetical protein
MHNIYAAIIFVSTSTCFDASTSSTCSLNLVFAEVTKLLKLLKIKITIVIISIVL